MKQPVIKVSMAENNLDGIVHKAVRKLRRKVRNEMVLRVYGESYSYANALSIIGEYVDVKMVA